MKAYIDGALFGFKVGGEDLTFPVTP